MTTGPGENQPEQTRARATQPEATRRVLNLVAGMPHAYLDFMADLGGDPEDYGWTAEELFTPPARERQAAAFREFLRGRLELAGLAGLADQAGQVDWLQVWDAVEGPAAELLGGLIELPDGADTQAALVHLAGQLGISLTPAPSPSPE